MSSFAPLYDHTPPFSVEAETSVIGALLIDRKAVEAALPVVREADFYREANRRIFRAAVALYQEGTVIDVVTLAEKLKAGGELDAAGGFDYLAALVDAVPTAANVEYHAKIVRSKAVLRRIVERAGAVIRTVYDTNGDGIGAVSTAISQLVAELEGTGNGEFKRVKEHIWGAFDKIEQMQDGKLLGIPTGYPRVDRMLCGLNPGDLIIVAARPSMGKTAWVLNALTNMAMDGVPAAVVSLEMSSEALLVRNLASIGRIDMQKLRRGKLTQEEHQRLAAAAGHLNTMPLWIDDHPVARVPELAAKVTQLVQREGVRALAIDYLQLMEGTGNEESRRLEIGKITRSLKMLALRLQIPIIVLSQLSRAPEARSNHRPLLSDLRESGDIEQDADVVMFLYRPEMYIQDGDSRESRSKAEAERERLEGKAELIIAKQRNGPTGTVPLYFQKGYTRFDSVDDRGPQPPGEEGWR